MEALFLQILNVGIMAGWIVLAVLLLRLCLKKAPRWITCLLWGLVALRLVLPVSLESAFSLIPSEQTVPNDIATMETPSIHTGVTVIDRPLNEMLQTVVPTLPAADSVPSTPPSGEAGGTKNDFSTLETVVTAGSWIWLVGVASMALYGLFSIWQVRRRVLDAVYLKENIWQSDRIATPFILGIFRPRIYLPYRLGENTIEQVLFHERAHLRRRDHWIKPFSFFLLAVYWFNPLLWVAYILLCRDIEVACDQRVLRQLPPHEHKQYAFALLECGVQRRTIAACPLAFGEVGVKQRIKNVLHYRKPLLWVVIASLLVCSVAAVCLLTVPESDLVVLNSREVEPDHERCFYGSDTDGSIVPGGLEWLWDHAENPRDKGKSDIPLVLTRSETELNELIDAMSDPQWGVDMRDWFELDKYDESYFEQNAIVSLFISCNTNYYDYTVTLEQTNKGLRYVIRTSGHGNSLFGGPPDRCQYLLLFEVPRDTAKQTKDYKTLLGDSILQESVDGVVQPLGNIDLDGDGTEEILQIWHDGISLDTTDVLVYEADGTLVLNETVFNHYYSQCYLLPQDDGSAKLLFVESEEDINDGSKSFGVVTYKNGVRTLEAQEYFYIPNILTNADGFISYANNLSAYLKDAVLLYEMENGTLYYGDDLGDTPRYQPLRWLDAYRKSDDDTPQDMLENVVSSLQDETVTALEVDLNQNGRKETLTLVTYLSNTALKRALLLRDDEGRIGNSFSIHTYFYDSALNQDTVAVYLVRESRKKERLLMVANYGKDDCYAAYLTKNGTESFLSDNNTESYGRQLDEVLQNSATLLFTVNAQGELTLAKTQMFTYRPSTFSRSYRVEVEVETDTFGAERVSTLSVWNKRRTKLQQKFVFADFAYDAYEYLVSTGRALYKQDVTFDGCEELLIEVANSARYVDFAVFRWDAREKQFAWLATPLRNPAIDMENQVVRTHTSGDQISSYSIWSYDESQQDFVCTYSLYFERNEQTTGKEDAMRLLVSENGKETKLFVPGEPYALDKTHPQVAPFYEDGSLWDLDSDIWTRYFFQSISDENQSEASRDDESQSDESHNDESLNDKEQSDVSQGDDTQSNEDTETDKTNPPNPPLDDISVDDEPMSGSMTEDTSNTDAINAIKVSDVVNKPKGEATSTLKEQGFNVVVFEEYDYYVEKGNVIRQSPDTDMLQLPGSNIVLYVSKGWQTATVTYDACGGDVSASKKTYKLTDSYGSLPVPTRTGYTFAGWYTEESGGTEITENTEITDPSAYTLYAHWDANIYSLSFDANGGSEAPADRAVAFGSAYGDLGTVSKEGFDFQGWYTAAEGGTKIVNDSLVAIAENHTLYAQWDVAVYEYTILYRSCNGTDLGSMTVSFQHGTTNTITPPDFKGYQTPLGRVIRCDTTSERTITFVYDPYEEGYAKTVDRGVWYAEGDKDILRYEVKVQCQNRTENSVEIRFTWTNYIIAYQTYLYRQNFSVYIDGNYVGDYWIGPHRFLQPNITGSGTSPNWITVPLSTTEQHEITFEGDFWDSNVKGRWSGTFTVPAY